MVLSVKPGMDRKGPAQVPFGLRVATQSEIEAAHCLPHPGLDVRPIHQGPVFAREGQDCVSASSDAYVHYEVGQEEIPPSALAALHFEER